MKMKETLKFLKFGLIGVASVTAISTLAISCNKSEGNKVDINNQDQIKQTLQEAKGAFTITSKGNHSTIFASDIANNETELKKYFNVTPGKGFGEDKGFIYTFKSAKPKGASSLDVVYDISYKDTKDTITRTLTQFKDKLVDAASKFDLKEKTGSGISNINPDTIKDEATLTKYFDFVGKVNDVTYQFLEAKPSSKDNHSLEVKYNLTYEGEDRVKEFSLKGFRDVNQIDYDLNNPADFFKIALDKNHLDTIAFFAQEYNFFTHDMFKTWTLNTDPSIYKETKTNKYFYYNNSKYYIWEVNFVESTEQTDRKMWPIIAEYGPSAPEMLQGAPVNALFTPEGKQRLPFLYAVKETETAKPVKLVKE